jgi:hypothetical protein
MSISLALVAVAISSSAAVHTHAWHPGHGHFAAHLAHAAGVEMVTMRGRVTCEAAPADASTQMCTFTTQDGKKYALVRVVTSRALFEDANLRSKDLEVTGQVDNTGKLEIIQMRSVKNGVLYDVYYWCETCHIRSPFGGDCWCCFQPFEFKEELIQKLQHEDLRS